MISSFALAVHKHTMRICSGVGLLFQVVFKCLQLLLLCPLPPTAGNVLYIQDNLIGGHIPDDADLA